MAPASENREERPQAVQKSSFELYREGRTPPEILLTIHMVIAARRWRSLLDERLRPIEQSSARMEALAAILGLPEAGAQVDIAKRLRIEGPTLTRMIDSLARDGLVERQPGSADRRTKMLRITTAGEKALEEIFGLVDPLRVRLLDGFAPETITLLNDIFAELVRRLDAGLPGTGGEAAG